MAKKVTGMIKLQVQAGKANPAPPIGPALGQHGVNIPGFCKEVNGKPNKTKVGQLTQAQVREIAEKKMPDLNAASIEAAMSMVKGTARSMGVTVADA